MKTLTLLCLLSASLCMAQKPARTRPQKPQPLSTAFLRNYSEYSFAVSLRVEQLALNDLIVSYERLGNKRWTHQFSLGFRPALDGGGNYKSGAGLAASGDGYTLFNNFHNGVYLSTAIVWHSLKKQKLSFAFEPFCRYWWYTNKHVSYENIEHYASEYNGNRSDRITVVGAKLLFGLYGFPLMIGDKKALMFRVNVGIGGRFKFYSYTQYDGTVAQQPVSGIYKEKGTSLYPTLHAGLDLGLAWK